EKPVFPHSCLLPPPKLLSLEVTLYIDQPFFAGHSIEVPKRHQGNDTESDGERRKYCEKFRIAERGQRWETDNARTQQCASNKLKPVSHRQNKRNRLQIVG